ncbi:MAG TPA: hypothetical protein DEA22_08810 [Blastocatellia bacterium]|nr:hypothetical protein [Blastocatellia bacterium]
MLNITVPIKSPATGWRRRSPAPHLDVRKSYAFPSCPLKICGGAAASYSDQINVAVALQPAVTDGSKFPVASATGEFYSQLSDKEFRVVEKDIQIVWV